MFTTDEKRCTSVSVASSFSRKGRTELRASIRTSSYLPKLILTKKMPQERMDKSATSKNRKRL